MHHSTSTPPRRRVVVAVVGVVLGVPILGLAGCGGTGTGATAASSPSSPSPVAVPEMPVYHEGDPRPLEPGTYATGGAGFFPGLKLTIPPGWTMTEADSGEIGLHPAANPDSALLLWKDMRAVVTHNRHHTVGDVRKDVGPAAEQLLDWLTRTPDFAIVSAPTATTVGDSVAGTQLTLKVSRTANFAWDDCPVNPRCAAIFTDPKHWGGNFYAIGGKETTRIFVATVHYPEGDHTLFVTLDAPNEGQLAKLASVAQPIIDSLRLPKEFINS